jgi:hypothetical protein
MRWRVLVLLGVLIVLGSSDGTERTDATVRTRIAKTVSRLNLKRLKVIILTANETQKY